MNYQYKTKDELIQELQKLQHENDLLKTSYEKDITERKLVEEELPKPGIPDKELMDLSRDVIFSLNPQGLFVSLNQAFEKITGWQTQEWIGKTFTDLLHPEDIPIAEERFSDLMKGHTAQAIGLRIRKKSGDYGCTEVLASPRMKKGMITGLMGIGRDITERKQLEEETNLRNEELTALNDIMTAISSSPDLRSIMDQALDKVLKLAGLECGSMYLLDQQVGKIVLVTYRGVSKEFADTVRTFKLGESLVGRAAQSGQPVVLNDVTQDSRVTTTLVSEQKILSFAAIPMISMDKVQGVMNIASHQYHFFNSKKIKLYCAIGNQVGMAIQNAWLHEVTQQELTERKQAEEALKMEKENFRHSLDDSPLGVRIATKDGETIYANKTLLDFYGYDNLGELQKTPLKDRYTPESYALAQERKLQRERGDFSATDYEISIVRKDGEIRHLQVFCKEVFWDGVRQFQVICNDITERRQAEKAQRENEELFRIVVSNTPISIFATDDKGIFILHEGKALEKVGMKPGENVGVSAYDLFSDLKVVEYNGNVISGKSVLNRVLNGKNLSGFTELNEVHFDNQFVPILDINNHVKGLIGVATDVTISQKMEETLRESEARFRSLFENSLIGISTASHDGKLLQANPVCARMYGYENPEMMLAEVTNVGKLYANTADRKEVLRILERKGFMEAKEYEVIRRDGSRFFVLVSACEIRDAEGKLLYNQATHIDLTERRKAVEEIRKSKKLLEDLHKHIDEIRENERTVISREIHDQIGQSLTALKLDLNRMDKYINTNPEAAVKLQGMIELISKTIKDVQRISSDLRPGILDDLGLAAAIEWYCDEFEKRTGIRYSLKLDDSIFGDSKKNLVFFRVFQEALTNVVRHANASAVTIKLRQSKQSTTMTIQDNGIGMHPGKAESAKSLGLIGMRERIRQFGGKIDILSEKGQGTKLTIFIPEKKTSML